MRPVSILGPLYYEELARLGRRGANFLLRVGFVLALLGLLYLFFPAGERLRIQEQATLSQRLFVGFAFVQFAALFFLTPLFAAGVLTEERERKILDVLLTTTLTVREIAVGKLLARLTFLAGVLLAGVPVMAVLRVYGGIGEDQLIALYVLLFAHLLGAGGLCAGIAASAGSYRVALYTSWVLLFFGQFCPVFGPGYVLPMLNGERAIEWAWVAGIAATNLIVGAAGMIASTWAVRPWESTNLERVRIIPTRPEPRRGELPVARPVAAPVYRRAAVRRHTAEKPPGLRADVDWLRPRGVAEGPAEWQVLCGLMFGGLAVGTVAGLARFDPLGDRDNWPVTSVFAWLPAAMLTAVQTSGTVSREREADTLTMLLTVPADRTEILWRKVLAGGTRHLWAFYIAAGIGFLLFAFSADRFWYPAYLFQGVGMVAAATAIGAWLTVTARTTFLSQAAAVMLTLFTAVSSLWASLVIDGVRAGAVMAGHTAFLYVTAVAGWYSAVQTFRGYAKR